MICSMRYCKFVFCSVGTLFVLAVAFLLVQLIVYETFRNVFVLSKNFTNRQTSRKNEFSRILLNNSTTLLGSNDTTEQDETKIILLWYPRDKDLVEIDQERCGRCAISTDKEMIDDRNTAAVVFHYKKIYRATMPSISKRRNDQYHVWMTGEAPASFYFRNQTLEYEDKYGFNLTMTYRRGSDVYRPYGLKSQLFSSNRVKKIRQNITDFVSSKVRLAVTLMSDCDHVPGAKYRLKLARELAVAGLELDTFGSCFSKPIPLNKQSTIEMISKYKFYFAFENSHHCRDYITEKFFINALSAGTVPVVWGATLDDYKAVAPEYSFIYAESFSGKRDLIKYLNYLDKNQTAYMEYFRWTTMEYPHHVKPTWFCHLCRILHNLDRNTNEIQERKKSSVINSLPARTVDLRKWFFENENSGCFATSFTFGS